MKRILFVDDEKMVLQALQRMLRPMRNEWAMAFAEGPYEALEILGNGPFDGSSLNRVGNPRLKPRHSGRQLQAS